MRKVRLRIKKVYYEDGSICCWAFGIHVRGLGQLYYSCGHRTFGRAKKAGQRMRDFYKKEFA